jgi:hypothetical protein
MAESINTRSVAWGITEAEDIILSTTPRTRTVFRAGIHAGGVRGHIVRQKASKGGGWEDVNEVNFSTMPADCGVSIELDTAATTILHEKLSQLYALQRRGFESGSRTYLIGREDEVFLLDDSNKAQAIRAILDQGHSEEFWEALSQSDSDLASRLAAAKIQFDRQRVIIEFESALVAHQADEAYWQNFFGENPWTLQSAFSAPVFMLNGETYLGGKMPVGRQGKGGVATDFLFADDTTKSFAVVEIKTPGAHLVGPRYRGKDDDGYDNEVYSMHADLSGGVVQVRNQVAVAVEDFQSVLGKTYDELNRVHPKGVLVIGSALTLRQRQKDSFNQFRYGLHSLTIITFDELLQRLKLLFGLGQDREDEEISWPSEPMDDGSDWEEEPEYSAELSF